MLEEKIFAEYKQALKDRDTLKSSLLSLLRAEFMNAALAKKKNVLDDNEILAVISKQAKQHLDSIEQFKKGGRQDLVDKEEKELVILNSYLPRQLSLEEVKKAVDEVIVSCGAQGMRDMSRVMKEVMAKLSASADGKAASDLVRAALAKLSA